MENLVRRIHCLNCGRPIHEGRNLYVVQIAVLGLRGVVALDDELFCCRACVAKRFGSDGSSGLVAPQRIP